MSKGTTQKSFCESRSVSKEVEQSYERFYLEFLEFCSDEGIDPSALPALDLALVDYIDFLYVEGGRSDAASDPLSCATSSVLP